MGTDLVVFARVLQVEIYYATKDNKIRPKMCGFVGGLRHAKQL